MASYSLGKEEKKGKACLNLGFVLKSDVPGVGTYKYGMFNKLALNIKTQLNFIGALLLLLEKHKGIELIRLCVLVPDHTIY